eukprot:2815577-Rhodomonas_salina.1
METKWGSMISLLRPAAAKFRLFQTPGDTLSQIFDLMADSCYEVFISHHPKMLECTRAKGNLSLAPKSSWSHIPTSATSGKGTGSKTWFNEAITACFSFQRLRDEPGLLARLFVV